MLTLPHDVIKQIDAYLPLKDYINLHSTCKQLGPCNVTLHQDKQTLFDKALFADKAEVVKELMNHKDVDVFKLYRCEDEGRMHQIGCLEKVLEKDSANSLLALLDHPQVEALFNIFGRDHRISHDFPTEAFSKIQKFSIKNNLQEVFEKLHTDDRFTDLLNSHWVFRDATSLLFDACEYGVADMVTKFLKFPDVEFNVMTDDFDYLDKYIGYHTCLSIACFHGYIEVVRLLLNDPRVKPRACKNLAYRTAVTSQQQEIADLLLEKCNIKHKFDVNYVKRLRSRR